MSKGHDWERIEADYRTGKYTTRELGKLHGLSHAAIAKRAKAKGWTQDMAPVVERLTREGLAQRAVDRVVDRVDGKLTDASQVVAAINIGVIESHRDVLGRAKVLGATLLEELASATRAAQVFEPEEVLSLAEAKGLSVTEVRNLLELRETAGRAVVLDKIAGSLSKLVPLERRAHGLDKEEAESGGLTEILAEARRIRAERAG